MVDVWLPYGKTEVCVRVSAERLQDIIKANEKPGVENPEEEIGKSLDNPIGAERLTEIVKSGDKVAVALNIPDAEIAKSVILSMLNRITQVGMESSDLTVILAHDPFYPEAGSLIEKLKSELSSLGINVIPHSFSSEVLHMGDLAGGVKINLNKVFAESEVKIAAGMVEPNPYTLYRWSGYTIIPGLSDIESIGQILTPTLNLETPSESVCKKIIEFSRASGVDFSINIVRNMKGEVVKSLAGDLEKTFHESAKVTDAIYRFPIEKRADIVFVSPGGFPFDACISNACGCLEHALRATKRNGTIVLVAECLEGYGSPGFYEAISRFKDDPRSLERSLRKKFRIGGFIAYRFLRAFRRADISMISVIPDYYLSEMPGLKIFRTANEALNYALEKSGRKSKVSAIPHGNLTVPAMKEPEITPEKK